MRSRTRDGSPYGLAYLSGILRMESGRTLAGISRSSGIDKQGMQHFISEGKWAGPETIARVHDEIAVRPELQEEAMWLLDESGDEHGGSATVGTSRQYLGRLGKVEQGQVGVFVSLVKGNFWTWLDGELYLPQVWFSEAYAERRAQVGLPQDRTFATKAEVGVQILERVRAHGIKAEAVGCDAFYGRDGWFRAELEKRHFDYLADVPASQRVYLSELVTGLPMHKKGRKAEHERVLSPQAYRVDKVRDHSDTLWQTLTVRATDRGELTAEFAARLVWTVWQDAAGVHHIRQETLVMRRDTD